MRVPKRKMAKWPPTVEVIQNLKGKVNIFFFFFFFCDPWVAMLNLQPCCCGEVCSSVEFLRGPPQLSG